MTKITVYDYNAEEIEEMAEKNETTTAEIIEALLTIIKEEKIDINGFFW